jgi:hypothetical protein
MRGKRKGLPRRRAEPGESAIEDTGGIGIITLPA